jgi:SET domain-containing protein
LNRALTNYGFALGPPNRTIRVVRQLSRVEFRTSPIHGTGGFATTRIEPGTSLIEYVGEKIDKTESATRCARDNRYIFHLDDEFDLDGNVEWNPARWLNHCCSPNCEARSSDGRIWIVAIRTIDLGEEITFNYNYDLEEYRDQPCRCGAISCVGFIVAEEFFDHVRQRTAVVEPSQPACSFLSSRSKL